MADTSALSHTTALSRPQHVVLTPREKEHAKTRQQKAEDVIYTLNHAITCLSVTDLFVVGAIANVYKKITNKVPGWAHDHGDEYGPVDWIKDQFNGKAKNYVVPEHTPHDHPHEHGAECGHTHPAAEPHTHSHGPEIHPKSSGREVLAKAWHNSKGWLLSEAIGDLGAVPVTVGLQRLAPGFMQGLRNRIEPVLGNTFRKNTKRAAENWGAKHGYAADSQEVVDRAQSLYEYEMSHMPQMAVWTFLSVAMNYGAIVALGKRFPEHFHDVTFKDFMANKVLGASITATLVLGVRGLTPNGAHWWDRTLGKNLVVPITKGVGSLVGVRSEDVDAFQKKRAGLENEHNHFPLLPSGDAASSHAAPSTKVHKSAEAAPTVERMQAAPEMAQAV